jgi:acyl carrier protein
MRIIDFDQVAQHVGVLLSVPVERLAPDTRIAELVPDSFMFVEVAVSLQEEYDVVFFPEDFETLHTLGDLTALLRSRREAPSDT